MSEDFIQISRSYLLVTNIPYYLDTDGRPLFDHAWHHDLVRHLTYLRRLMLAAPLQPMPSDPSNLVSLDETSEVLKLIPLHSQTSRLRALISLPVVFWKLWRAVGHAEIVHTGVAGWPYPLGWLASLIARLRGKKLMIIVESAPWRLSSKPEGRFSFAKKSECRLYEWMAQFWCSRADLSFYTQDSYLKQFHRNGKGAAYVTPATWINAEDVLDDEEAEASWRSKLLEEVRFLFAGRLVADKGINVLLAAVEKLNEAGVRGAVHVIGDGPLRERIVAAQCDGPFALRYFQPVPYGRPFFTFLQGYHALLIPSLGDEQPRIVFDAAARAVSVLASATDGLRSHIENNCTGRLLPPGDAFALAGVMADLSTNAGMLQKFGMKSLARVRGKTHRAMHVERSRIIAEQFGAKKDRD